ncbi:hypothetical protein AVEN_174107-1 [Araneus ventricosus]|uniref:Uncharacterized protein n=1 Tax=Araneus ventricosus TaxID=182803 RepID=A0A4Y2C1H3_ARAVE|nr:hypothetical protein AVEN_174107-1 [Araneus ventricosus]
MKLQCTIVPYLNQCDHFSRGSHTASCTQHSRRLKIMCHQECSASSYMLSFKVVSVRTPPDRHWTSNNPTGKKSLKDRSEENGHGECCVQNAMCDPREG